MADFANQPVDYASLIGQGQNLAGNPVAQQQANVNLQNSQIAGQQVQQQMAMQRYALQRQQMFGSDLGNYVKNPTASGLATLFGKYPEYEQQAAAARGALDRGDITELGSAAALAAKGQYGEAAKVIQGRIDAETSAGTDPAKIAQSRHVLDLLNSNDPQQQKGALGLLSLGVGIAVGPEKAAEFLKANGLSSEPIDVAMDHRLVTASGQPIVGANPKLENVTNPVTGESTGFNPYTGTYGAAASGAAGTPAAPSTGGGGPVSGAGQTPPPPVGADAVIAHTIGNEGHPGNSYNPKDANGSPTNWGINFKANQAVLAKMGITAANFKNMTQQQAEQVYSSKYWPQSGAAKLAPNLQAPYFDAYVRSPKIAKMALAQSGGDPQKFVQIASAAFQKMASNPNSGTAPYAQSWANRDANNMAIAKGGAPTAVPAQTDAYHFGTPGLNTKEAPPGYAWNPQHNGVVPIPGSEVDPNANNPQEVDDLARNWLTTGQWGGGGGGMGGGNIPAPLKKQAMARASQLMQSIGITADDLPRIRSEFGAAKTSLASVTGLLSNLQASENALHTNAQQVWNYHAKLRTDGIIGDNPWINRQRLSYYENFGNAQQKADVKGYRDSINAYSTEYSKFMTSANGMGGSAAPSDSAREQAGELNDEGLPATAMLQHLRQGEVEASNKRQGVEKQKTSLEGKLSSLLRPHSGPPGQPSPAHVLTPPPPEHPVNIPLGAVQMLKANPSLAPMFDQKYGAGKARQILGR